MENKNPRAELEKGKDHDDDGFRNEPDDPNNPNEARERFEREVMEDGKVPDEKVTDKPDKKS